jgi:hypothetical protein
MKLLEKNKWVISLTLVCLGNDFFGFDRSIATKGKRVSVLQRRKLT